MLAYARDREKGSEEIGQGATQAQGNLDFYL
jgi:hypothetical protein